MRKVIVVIAFAVFAGCGVENATTAATGAVIKQQEVEAGKKSMEQAQQKIDAAMQQSQQRAEKDAIK